MLLYDTNFVIYRSNFFKSGFLIYYFKYKISVQRYYEGTIYENFTIFQVANA